MAQHQITNIHLVALVAVVLLQLRGTNSYSITLNRMNYLTEYQSVNHYDSPPQPAPLPVPQEASSNSTNTTDLLDFAETSNSTEDNDKTTNTNSTAIKPQQSSNGTQTDAVDNTNTTSGQSQAIESQNSLTTDESLNVSPASQSQPQTPADPANESNLNN